MLLNRFLYSWKIGFLCNKEFIQFTVGYHFYIQGKFPTDSAPLSQFVLKNE